MRRTKALLIEERTQARWDPASSQQALSESFTCAAMDSARISSAVAPAPSPLAFQRLEDQNALEALSLVAPVRLQASCEHPGMMLRHCCVCTGDTRDGRCILPGGASGTGIDTESWQSDGKIVAVKDSLSASNCRKPSLAAHSYLLVDNKVKTYYHKSHLRAWY